MRIFAPFFCERLGLKGMATKLEWCFKHGGRFLKTCVSDSSSVLEMLGNWRTLPENTVGDDILFTFSLFSCEMRLCEEAILS